MYLHSVILSFICMHYDNLVIEVISHDLVGLGWEILFV